MGAGRIYMIWLRRASPGPVFSVLHRRDSPQTELIAVAGDKHQIHDLRRSSEKPVSRVAVRQEQLLGQQDLVGGRVLPRWHRFT